MRVLPIVSLAILLALPGLSALGQDDTPKIERVHRPGAVHVEKEYDLSGLTIPLAEIHELLPRDAIPSLTDPELEPIAGADWLQPGDRLAVISIDGETVGVPFRVLNWHEIANLEVGGEPVAATY